MSNEKTKAILNQTVADLAQASALVHQTHWYMRGRGFLKLHPKMDEYIDDLNEFQDEFAERLITIGGSPLSTLKEFAEASKIKLETATWDKSMDERLEGVLATYKYLAGLFKEGLSVSEADEDAVTVDLYTGALGDVEKTIWMLEAELA
ncbi:DNA starvation/stationary phase protection protein [Lactococcus nasutitermitis]|uniref:DNA starvation/stationary phase protection protein n=1 Tax=Lactococcus nasutitermitis TaxID=1652957 RepID=A0ABV9JCV3_9LACT|nr:Dps family protein [Lactococcus nasutitermitis]